MSRVLKALAFRNAFMANRRATQSLIRVDDLTGEEILDILDLYNDYKIDTHYDVGELFKYNGTLYKVIQAHTSSIEWLPDNTPAIYTPYTHANVIPQWVKPTGSHDSYGIGDKVIFNDVVYESVIANNTWSPEEYPAGWGRSDI